MKLRTADYLMTRFAHSAAGALKLLGEMETDALGAKLAAIPIDRPVFISGLARSGTTILLNLFAGLPGVGTHRYRDFPFLFVPYWWNLYQDRLAGSEAPVERPHKDRIVITKESAEAFEEPLWMHFFPDSHRAAARHVLSGADVNPKFDEFYRAHLRKILLVRGARRYVSKGNYNIARLGYIARLLPDARFIVPIRHPVTHVHSLMRQHELFTAYAAADARVPQYLRAAGHYEFGPQRVPINVDDASPQRIRDAWAAGDDDLGYAIMWRSVYAHVRRLAQAGGPLAHRIKVVRYEDFCARPRAVLRDLFDFCELTQGKERLLDTLPEISAPQGSARRCRAARACLAGNRRSRGIFGYKTAVAGERLRRSLLL